jgi:creatinine amidohydrolase
MVDWPALTMGGPDAVRAGLGDGNFGGRYVRSDEDVMALWRVAIAETRALAESW